MKQSTAIVGISSLVLGAVMVGAVWGQVQLPSVISNLTQTLKKSLILNENNQPQITLDGEKGEIQISTGAFRDKSIVPEDIVGYAQGVAHALGCTGGKILHGIENGHAKCMDMPQVTQWKSSDGGRDSIYFVKKNNQNVPAVAVGTDINYANTRMRAEDGLAVKGNTTVGKALVVGNGLKIIKRGTVKAVTSRGFWPWDKVYAQQGKTTDYSEIVGSGAVVVGSSYSFDNKKSIAIGADEVHDKGAVTIGGNVAVDGGRYLTSGSSAFALSQLNDGGWLTTKAGKTGTSDTRLGFGTKVVIGRQTSTPDAALEIQGDTEVYGQDADFIFVDKKALEDTVHPQLKPEDGVGGECLALSLDKQHQVVLVNVCAGRTDTTGGTDDATGGTDDTTGGTDDTTGGNNSQGNHEICQAMFTAMGGIGCDATTRSIQSCVRGRIPINVVTYEAIDGFCRMPTIENDNGPLFAVSSVVPILFKDDTQCSSMDQSECEESTNCHYAMINYEGSGVLPDDGSKWHSGGDIIEKPSTPEIREKSEFACISKKSTRKYNSSDDYYFVNFDRGTKYRACLGENSNDVSKCAYIFDSQYDDDDL